MLEASHSTWTSGWSVPAGSCARIADAASCVEPGTHTFAERAWMRGGLDGVPRARRSRGVKDDSFREGTHVDLVRRESLDDQHDAATVGTGRR
jgi:hypothetical protein